jgi:hypothetical protein
MWVSSGGRFDGLRSDTNEVEGLVKNHIVIRVLIAVTDWMLFWGVFVALILVAGALPSFEAVLTRTGVTGDIAGGVIVIAALVLVGVAKDKVNTATDATEKRRAERDTAICEEVEALEREHPELARMRRLLELTKEVKAEKPSRRSFSLGFAQNIFFLVAGFAISYFLVKQGVL